MMSPADCFNDMYPLWVRSSSLPLYISIVGSVLGCLLVLFAYYFYKKRKNKKEISRENNIRVQLQQLKNYPHQSDEEKRIIYERMVDLFKQSLSYKYKSVIHLTDYELLDYIQIHSFDQDIIILLPAIIEHAFESKFAQKSFSHECLQEDIKNISLIIEKILEPQKLA